MTAQPYDLLAEAYAEHFPFAENEDVIALIGPMPKVRDYRSAAALLARSAKGGEHG